ncbi:MAG: hypothetical protein AAGC72_14150 [Planctomycetota bacterium]
MFVHRGPAEHQLLGEQFVGRLQLHRVGFAHRARLHQRAVHRDRVFELLDLEPDFADVLVVERRPIARESAGVNVFP